MRIISDFKDYYDSALGFGIDPNVRYMRKREVLERTGGCETWMAEKKALPPLFGPLQTILDLMGSLPHRLNANINAHYQREYSLEIPTMVKVIGFCGLLYPAIEIDGKTFFYVEKVASGLSPDFLKKYRLDAEKLDAILQQKRTKSPPWKTEFLTTLSWTKRCEEIAGKRFDNIFIEMGAPIFMIEREHQNIRRDRSHGPTRPDMVRYAINPFLKPHDFQKVFGPAEAFQELAMYVGNQLARQPDPISTVSDEIMRDQKGFDKWSFRRHKEDDTKFKKSLRNP
ncbi:MAG TPA: hypothetical protein PLJ47_03045 [Candidatus Hydrogenedentes bacterium]|nr:hypothetical protein [Candidatus Hydrogenedentota bacterium]